MLGAIVARSRAPPRSSPVSSSSFSLPKTLIPCSPFSHRRKVHPDEGGDGNSGEPPKLLVVQPRLRPESRLRFKLSEALNLANSLEEQRDVFYGEDFGSKKMPPHLVVQNPPSRSVRADTYFGPGTVKDIQCHLNNLESKGELDAVFVNTILSGIQQRNLEVAWGKPVLDRVGLIIEIFHAHAETKEAKLQSELAALMYKKSRLVRVRGPGGRLTFGTGGEAQVVSARGKGSGGRGFISGAGESELQLQRQRIKERQTHLLSLIEEVRRTRAVQRASRKRHGDSHGRGLATIAVVGYTNAGKSTLVNALSASDVYSDDRLFATVDPRLRSVILPSGRKILLSDTVGFISDLPVQLVEAFHATLEEVVEADLLVHVLDASAPDLAEQRTTVLQVLQQIGVAEEKIREMVEVWNKIDLVNKDIGIDEPIEEDFLSRDEENEKTISGEEYENGVEEGEDKVMFEEDEISPRREWFGGDDREDGSFPSDPTEYYRDSDLSSEETMESVIMDRQSSSLKQHGSGFGQSLDARAIQHVETSAVMGVGLQELLNVIDEKLTAQNTSVATRSLGPFDRKWRPSPVMDSEKAA